MTALVDLAALVKDRREQDGGRLILRCGPDAYDRLISASLDAGHGGSIVPAVPLGPGEGRTYRQVEVILVATLAGPAWQLTDGGEVVREGEL